MVKRKPVWRRVFLFTSIAILSFSAGFFYQPKYGVATNIFVYEKDDQIIFIVEPFMSNQTLWVTIRGNTTPVIEKNSSISVRLMFTSHALLLQFILPAQSKNVITLSSLQSHSISYFFIF